MVNNPRNTKRRRVFALLALLMALAFAASACGGGAATTTTASATTAAAAGDATTAATTTAATTAPAAASGEIPTLIWFMGTSGTPPTDQAIVEDRLNEISVEKLGVKVKTIYYTNEQVLLAMTSGENYDISFTAEWYNNYPVQALAGYFADITDKVQTETPELYASMPEVVWEGTKVNGKIMAIPVKKDYAAELFWILDKALFVDELKMEIPDAMSFYDGEKYMKAAKDAFKAGVPAASKAEYPMHLARSGVGGIWNMFDMINQDVKIGVSYDYMGTPDENKILFVPEDKQMMDYLKAIHRWYTEGYITPDAMTIEQVPDTEYKAVDSGQGFYGADGIWSGGRGYTVLISKWGGPNLSTASIRGALNAFNAKSKNLDLALKYQELVNLDQEYRDILRYGVESTHWNKTPEGLVQKTDQGRSGYNVWAFSQGSYSLSSVEATEGVKVDPNMWKVIFDGYKDIKSTNSIGFSFDPISVEAELAACGAIYKKYDYGLVTGTLDPETEVPKMKAEMESAGLSKIIDECQKQYDAFVAAKN
ncbi:MAG: ABC transporter substrate-binding protein [Clostridiales bacterium]|jgi:putative aldouronate transport system substrate-binding protein|nr:ABC transporter substrate-binding protein [Clostridiales bacterium]